MEKVIDSALLNTLRKEINTEIAELGKKYGVSLKVGNASYTPETFKFKLEGGLLVNGIAVDKDRQLFKARAWSYGLNPTDLDREFIFQGHGYKIVGLKTSSRKYPIIAEQLSNGKKYKFAISDVKALIEKKETKNNNCKYCGKPNNSADPDVLCQECKDTFGHSFYREL